MKFRILKDWELINWYYKTNRTSWDTLDDNEKKLYHYRYTDFCHLTGAVYFPYYCYAFGYYDDYMEFVANFWLDSDKPVLYYPWGGSRKRSESSSFVSAYVQTHLHYSASPNIGVRPILNIDEALENGAVKIENGNILYGEYPQDIVDDEFASRCNDALNSGSCVITGKKYSVNGNTYDEYLIDGRKVSLAKFEICDDIVMRFSNNRRYFYNQKVWVEVKPVEWIPINECEAISKMVLFPSIYNEKHCTFEESALYRNLNGVFASEIIPSSVASLDNLFSFESKAEDGMFVEGAMRGAERGKSLTKILKR